MYACDLNSFNTYCFTSYINKYQLLSKEQAFDPLKWQVGEDICEMETLLLEDWKPVSWSNFST